MSSLDKYLNKIKSEIHEDQVKAQVEEVGWIDEAKDGVAFLTGLDNVSYGELIEFENGTRAQVIDMDKGRIGAIILGDFLKLKSGDQAKATGFQASILASNKLLGRVVNPLGDVIDGGEKITEGKRYPMEKIAPSVVYRKGVNVPLQTGIKAIDALLPIGRGQRELIIGDRGTGKTTIALDTILNQKGENVVCIYCAIGQKESKIAQVVELLKKNGAMDYTIVVSASASDPVSLQYLAPYSACAIGEYFMDQGKDALIIYDDLSKHAWAYRQLSLILRRPAGREAYPGDIFYLHSKLLERACCIDPKYGGGSLTALPIVETLEGDMSAYIPTNIISITDGQIFLETELFNAGIRPAINVGISVSRVGGNAQTKAIKQVAGKLKLDLAQYREMASFSQFESELDEETKKFLNRGAKITQILRQDKHKTLNFETETAILWAVVKGFVDELPLEKINEFENKYVEDLKSKGVKVLASIRSQKQLTEKEEKELEKIVKETMEGFVEKIEQKI